MFLKSTTDMLPAPVRSRETPYPMQRLVAAVTRGENFEAAYGRIWAQLARSEGHKTKLPKLKKSTRKSVDGKKFTWEIAAEMLKTGPKSVEDFSRAMPDKQVHVIYKALRKLCRCEVTTFDEVEGKRIYRLISPQSIERAVQ